MSWFIRIAAITVAAWFFCNTAAAQFLPEDQIPLEIQNQVIAEVIAEHGHLDMSALEAAFRDWLLAQPLPDADGQMLDAGTCSNCSPPIDGQNPIFPSVRDVQIITREGRIRPSFKVKWRRPVRLPREIRDLYELDSYEVFLVRDDGIYEHHEINKTLLADGTEKLKRRIRFRRRDPGFYTVHVRPVYVEVEQTETEPSDPLKNSALAGSVSNSNTMTRGGAGGLKGGWGGGGGAPLDPATDDVEAALPNDTPLRRCILANNYSLSTILNQVTYLYCPYAGVVADLIDDAEMSVLSDFINLQTFNIADHAVTDISPLQNLQDLQHLNVSGNQGINLSALSGMDGLQFLFLESLGLTSLPVLSSLVDLNTYSLTNNNLGAGSYNCSMATPIAVNFFNVDDNNLGDSDLDLLSQFSIGVLNISNNQFISLSELNSCPGLLDVGGLDISNNSLAFAANNIDLSNYEYFSLNLSNTNLPVLPDKLPEICGGELLLENNGLMKSLSGTGSNLPEVSPNVIRWSGTDDLVCPDHDLIDGWYRIHGPGQDNGCVTLGIPSAYVRPVSCDPGDVSGFSVTRDPNNHVHHFSWDELLLESQLRDFSYEIERRQVGATLPEGTPYVIDSASGGAAISTLAFDLAYEFRIRRCVDNVCSPFKGQWLGAQYPLTKPVGLLLTWTDPVAGDYQLRWSYPENYFDNASSRPDFFQIELNNQALGSPFALGFQSFWQLPGQFTEAGIITIKACQGFPGTPTACGSPATIRIDAEPEFMQPIEAPTSIGVAFQSESPDLTITINADAQQLQADEIDYFEILETGASGSQVFTYFHDISAARTQSAHDIAIKRLSGGGYSFQARACRRNRLSDSDSCSAMSASSPEVHIDPQATEFASINPSLCWDDNSAGDGVVLSWNYNPPAIPGETFKIPEAYRLSGNDLTGPVTEPIFVELATSPAMLVSEISNWVIDLGGNGEVPGSPINGEYIWTIEACDLNTAGNVISGCQLVGFIDFPLSNEPRRCTTPPQAPNSNTRGTGGPGDLNPGVYLNEDVLPRQGFTFFWASDLRYDNVHEEYGNTYDLYVYWQTYQFINGVYTPVWLYGELKQSADDIDVFDGALYLPKTDLSQNNDQQAGYFYVEFTEGDSSTAMITIDVDVAGGLFTDDSPILNLPIDQLSSITSVLPPGGSANITDFNNGVWYHENGGSKDYKILSWQHNYFEGQIMLSFDTQGRAIWLNGTLDCRFATTSDCFPASASPIDRNPVQTDATINFVTVEQGLPPFNPTASEQDSVTSVVVGTLDRTLPSNALPETSPDELNFAGSLGVTLTDANGTQFRTFSLNASGGHALTKEASFHDIRYTVNGVENESTCPMDNGYCEIQLTWFSDDDFFGTGTSSIRAYLRHNGQEQALSSSNCTISDPPSLGEDFVVRDYVCRLSQTGDYEFLLKNRDGAPISDDNIITVSASLQVTPGQPESGLLSGNPEMPPLAANVPSPVPMQTSTQIGATAGSFDVDESGAATYQIPIITAPGSAGVTPQLALQYSSQAGNDVGGVGWSIGGMSSVARCGQTYATDAQSTSVQLTGDDRLCLDGQKLIKVGGGGDYWASGSEYHTEVDSITRITSVGSGPQYFKVERLDGSVSYYGNTDDSRIVAGGSGIQTAIIYVWAQNRMSDSASNYIDYHYSHPNGTADPDGDNSINSPVEYYLDEVRYTGNLTEAQLPNAVVRFNYEDKNAVEIGTGYLAGAELTNTKRLESITSVVTDDAAPTSELLLRHYRLEYETDPFSRSLLRRVRECWDESNINLCLNPTTFTWNSNRQDISNTGSIDIAGDFGATAAQRHILDPRFADMNGDGRNDLIYVIDFGTDDYRVYVSLSQPYTDNSTSVFENISPANGNHFWTHISLPDEVGEDSLWQLIDFDADGYQDIVYPNGGGWTGYRWDPTGQTGHVNGPHAIGDVRQDSQSGQSEFPALVRSIDINGDGLNDLLYAYESAELTININTSLLTTGDPDRPFDVPVIATLPNVSSNCPIGGACTREITFEEQTEIFDYNGDGAVDLLLRERLDSTQTLAPGGGLLQQQYGYVFMTPAAYDLSGQQRAGNIDAELWSVMTSNRDGTFSYGEIIARENECESDIPLCNQLPEIKENHAYLIDLNGDSLADFVYQECGNNNNCDPGTGDDPDDLWYYRLNTGIGFAGAVLFGNTRIHYEADQVRFIDYRGDGITDIIWTDDDDNDSATWKILGNSYAGFDNNFTNTTAQQFHSGDIQGGDISLFSDVTGDGKLDHLYFNYAGSELDHLWIQWGRSVFGDEQQRYTYQAHNVIDTITDGLGALTQIEYKSLVQPSVYTRSTNGAFAGDTLNSPVFDIVPAYYVVSQVESSAPASTLPLTAIDAAVSGNPNFPSVDSDTSSIDYHYAGAKIQGDGRGFLGFEKLGTFERQNRILTISSYYQDFPFIGAPLMTERYYLRPGFEPWIQTDDAPALFPCQQPDGNCATGGFDTGLTDSSNNPRAVLLSMSLQDMDTVITHTNPATNAPVEYPFVAESTEWVYSPQYDVNQVADSSALVSRTVTTNNGYSIYGEVGQVKVEVFNPSIDPNVARSTITTVNTYDDNNSTLWHLGRLTRSVVTHQRPNQSNEVRTSEFDYYSSTGLLRQEVVEPGVPALTITTTHTLDNFGNRISTNVTGTGVNRTVQMDYDQRGRYVVREINALNQIATEVPTRSGSSAYEFDHFGNVLRQLNQQGVETRMAYDELSREYFSGTDALGSYRTIYRYDTNLSVVCPVGVEAAYYEETITAGAPSTRVCFDLLGRQIRQSTQGFTLNVFTQGDWIHVDTRYDDTGQTSEVSEPYYHRDAATGIFWNRTVCDELDRPIAVIAANGGLTTTDYDGLVTTVVNPINQSRVESKNVMNEAIQVIDDLGGVIGYEYDAIGRLKATDGTLTGTVDRTTMTYNKLGHKLSMSDPDKGFWQYRYNILGEITCQRDGRGMGSSMSYDDLGRVVARIDWDSLDINTCMGSNLGMTTWLYNNTPPNPGSLPLAGYGQLRQSTSVHNGVEIIKNHDYDPEGRLEAATTTTGGQSWVQSTTYDQHSRIFQQFDATGSDYGVQMVYNAEGYLQQQIEAHDTGDAGTTDPIYQTIQAMDARGNITRVAYGNNVLSLKNYDADDGQMNSTTSFSGGQTIQDLVYQFDDIGNLQFRDDRRQQLKEAFTYDALNRMTNASLFLNGSATASRVDQTDYDSAGNIISKSGVGTYLYGSQCTGNAGPHAVCQAGTTTYSYDVVGNMTSDSDGRQITYSAFNKSDRIQSSGNKITDYWYGADRNRFQRIENNGDGTDGTTIFIGSVEFITKADGTRLYKRYIGDYAIQDLYLQNGNTTLDYTCKDHLGSIDVVTEGDNNPMTGQVTMEMSFGAWGERRSTTGWDGAASMVSLLRSLTPKGFTGHEMIEHANIIHMNGRIYDAKLGRFLQADPMVQAPENSQNLNRYSYVLNNPLSYTDPSGYFFKSIGNFIGKYWKQIAAIGIGVATAGIASGLSFWAGLGTSIAGGAAAGYVSTGTLKGALLGAFSGAAFYGVGQHFKTIEQGVRAGTLGAAGRAIANNLRLAKSITHGVVGGVVSKLQGARFGHGFLSAGITKAFSKIIARISTGEYYSGVALQTTAAAVVGGGISEVTGGKFANGARTAGFGYLFNQVASEARNLFEKRNSLDSAIERTLSAGRAIRARADDHTRNDHPHFAYNRLRDQAIGGLIIGGSEFAGTDDNGRIITNDVFFAPTKFDFHKGLSGFNLSLGDGSLPSTLFGGRSSANNVEALIINFPNGTNVNVESFSRVSRRIGNIPVFLDNGINVFRVQSTGSGSSSCALHPSGSSC